MDMNLSFAGCGFLGIYHAGVASCFKEYAPDILVNKISGASAGAIAACALICGCSMGQVTSDVLKIATTARKYTFGPFSPNFQIVKLLRERLNAHLPPDAHIRCNKRLHVSVTRVSDGQNVILSEFNTRDELIQALLCSSFIPIFSGYFPEKFRGIRYIDGCYSNNLPILDANTVTVSPFCGESDICPRDNSYNLFQVNLANTSIELSPQNLYRVMRILFPPHPEILSEMCHQGFDDALRFLQKNSMYCCVSPELRDPYHLISCTRCIAINSTLKIKDGEALSDSEEEIQEEEEIYEDDCTDCRELRQEVAKVDELPEAVLAVLEEATLAMNSGFINWVFKHKSMRVLSVLTLPYVLPLDIAHAAYQRFKAVVPKWKRDLNVLAEWFIRYLKNLIQKFNNTHPLYRAKFSCQLAITEYDFQADEQLPPQPPLPRIRRSGSLGRRGSYIPVCTGRRPSPKPRPRSGDWGDPCPHRERKISSGSRVMGFNFSVDLANMSPPLTPHTESVSKPTLLKAMDADRKEETAVHLANRALNLKAAEVFSHGGGSGLNSPDADTFEQVLHVTQQQEAVMAYYYLDENNEMKVTGIYNATDPDTGAVLLPHEHEANRELQWDEDFSQDMAPSPTSRSSSISPPSSISPHQLQRFLSASTTIEFDDESYEVEYPPDNDSDTQYNRDTSIDSAMERSYFSLGDLSDEIDAVDMTSEENTVTSVN